MKRIIPALVAVSALLAVAACQGNTASDKITLTFVSYNYGTPDIGGQGTQELIDAFEAANPNIDIQPQGAAVKDILTKVRTATAAGTPPDVAQLGWSKMAEAYATLPIVPVQKIPSESEWTSAVDGITPAILAAGERDGVIAAMPYTMSTPVLFYNAKLFTQAGLDPQKPPTTMTEVKTAALAIAKSGAQGVYFGVADSGKSDFLTQSVISSNGGSLVDDDGTVTLDQKPAVDALAALQDLTKSGAQPAVNTEDALAAFKAGKLGMLVSSTALLASLDKATKGSFELRTGAFPGFDGKPARPTYSGAGLVVLSKDKAKQEAAWAFLKYLTSPEAFTIITGKIGYLPLRPAIVDDPKYLKSYFDKDNRLRPSLEQLENVTPYTSFPGERANQAVVTLQDDAVEPIVLRGADPQKTLSDVAGRIRGLVGQ